MDIKNLLNKVCELFKKYKYAALILVVGIVLMLLPASGSKNTGTSTNSEKEKAEISIEEQMESLLSVVEGAGKVKVFLSVDIGEEIIYQTDQDASVSGDSESTNSKTVIIQDINRNESGLIRKVNAASYKGAIIVCQGADSSTVRLAIIDAVSNVTGLGSDRISVLKMK